MTALRITSGIAGTDTKIELDGTDISNALFGISLHGRAGAGFSATLDMRAFEVDTESEDVDVQLPDTAREVLVKLGWTPPEGT
ncbi:MAG: hypothetical protein JWN52_8093 [Actinomycetia bacterium]|nr:hypothetical protein [Actinomycetes bacterium]